MLPFHCVWTISSLIWSRAKLYKWIVAFCNSLLSSQQCVRVFAHFETAIQLNAIDISSSKHPPNSIPIGEFIQKAHPLHIAWETFSPPISQRDVVSKINVVLGGWLTKSFECSKLLFPTGCGNQWDTIWASRYCKPCVCVEKWCYFYLYIFFSDQ